MDKNKFSKKYDVSDAEIDDLLKIVEQAATNYASEKLAQKEALATEIKNLKDKNEELLKTQMNTEDYKIRQQLMDERMAINKQIPLLQAKLDNLENLLKAVQNGGSIVSFEDALGNTLTDIPDFRNIPTNTIVFDQETILVEPLPIYIPVINEKAFEQAGCVFDAVRVAPDSYLLAPFRYKYGQDNQFIIVTLDQLMLTNLYYITKLKAEYQAEADEKNRKGEEYYFKLPLERREKHFAQRGIYSTLPAKVKKQISEQDFIALPLAEKEKLHIPVHNYGPKKIKSKLQENQMWVSFHNMYNQFVNKEALPFTKKGDQYIPIPLGQQGYGIYSNPEVAKYWKEFRDMMEFKIKDIQFQREEISENYKTAMETSFGSSNTKDTLLADYGVLVKRQNGDAINPAETEQIRESLERVFSVFGNLKDRLLEHNIKISHTGNRLVFARKAIGVYVSSMGTIASSNKYSDVIFNTTMAHEVAHFIDDKLGEKHGKRWETDDFESTAGKIAFTFRNNMNKPKQEQTDYINATKECFARALEQYFAVKTYGDDVEIVYSDSPAANPEKVFTQDAYVGKNAFYEQMVPLIEQFLEENKDFLGTKNQIPDVGKKVDETQEIYDTIAALELLLETADESEKEEINDTISALQILLLN